MTLIVKGVTIPTNGDFVKYGGTNVTKVNVKMGSAAAVTVWEKQTFTTRDFGYTGGMQSVVVPPGLYKLEAWGAQGGNAPGGGTGGYGGYSCVYQYFASQTTLYVCVGGAGQSQPGGNGFEGNGDGWLRPGGYNGGGATTNFVSYTLDCGTGGGATHISPTNKLLKDMNAYEKMLLYVVAGGGGGGSYSTPGNATPYYGTGGAGGGLNGGDGITSYNVGGPGRGGTQSSGGESANNGADGQPYDSVNGIVIVTTYDGSFGQGGYCTVSAYTGGGGGGGYYGGGCGMHANGATPGGGGSGFIRTASTTHGGVTYTNQSTAGSRAGDGYARITFVAA